MSVTIAEVPAPPKRKRLSLEDLLNKEHVVPISETEELVIRPLTLTEMLNIFFVFQDPFIALYGQYMSKGVEGLDLSVFLFTAPEMVARIIAMSAADHLLDDQELTDNTKKVFENMPGTVQLIALLSIWEVSVPDPKKLGQLLSVVTAQLRKLQDEAEKQQPAQPVQKISPTESPKESNSSLPEGTS